MEGNAGNPIDGVTGLEQRVSSLSQSEGVAAKPTIEPNTPEASIPQQEALMKDTISRLEAKNQQVEGNLFAKFGEGESSARIFNTPLKTMEKGPWGESRPVRKYLVATDSGFMGIQIERWEDEQYGDWDRSNDFAARQHLEKQVGDRQSGATTTMKGEGLSQEVDEAVIYDPDNPDGEKPTYFELNFDPGGNQRLRISELGCTFGKTELGLDRPATGVRLLRGIEPDNVEKIIKINLERAQKDQEAVHSSGINQKLAEANVAAAQRISNLLE